MERAPPIALAKKGTRVGGGGCQSPIKVIFQLENNNTLNPPRGIIFTFYRTLLLVTMYLINGYTPHHEQGARNTPCHIVLDSSLHENASLEFFAKCFQVHCNICIKDDYIHDRIYEIHALLPRQTEQTLLG